MIWKNKIHLKKTWKSLAQTKMSLGEQKWRLFIEQERNK